MIAVKKIKLLLKQCIKSYETNINSDLMKPHMHQYHRNSAILARFHTLLAVAEIRSLDFKDYICYNREIINNELEMYLNAEESMRKIAKFHDLVFFELQGYCKSIICSDFYKNCFWKDIFFVDFLRGAERVLQTCDFFNHLPSDWFGSEAPKYWIERFRFFFKYRAMFGKKYQTDNDIYCNNGQFKRFEMFLHNLGLAKLDECCGILGSNINGMSGKQGCYFYLIYNLCSLRECFECGNKRAKLYKCTKNCNKSRKFYFCSDKCHGAAARRESCKNI